MLLTIAAVHIRSFVAMLQACRSWRVALKAEEEWLWERLARIDFLRLEDIIRLSPASAQVTSYRRVYRQQLQCECRMKQSLSKGVRKGVGPAFDEIIFTIELSKRPPCAVPQLQPHRNVPVLVSWTGRISNSQARSTQACRIWALHGVPDCMSRFGILSPTLYNLNLRIYATWKLSSIKIYDGNCEGVHAVQHDESATFRWLFELEGGRQPIVNMLAPLVPYVMPEIDATTGAVSFGFQWNWSDAWVDRMMLDSTSVDSFIPMSASDLDNWKDALEWTQEPSGVETRE